MSEASASDMLFYVEGMLPHSFVPYNNPPEISKTVVSVNGVPLGTYDNLLCITGGEGTGKSNFVSALIAGTLTSDPKDIDTLGFEVCANYSDKAVLHYDTEYCCPQNF